MYSMAVRVIQSQPSTNIAQVSYDDETMTLIIRFVRGNRTYTYKQVPANVADGFATSGMRANAYFNQTVLNQYQHQELT